MPGVPIALLALALPQAACTPDPIGLHGSARHDFEVVPVVEGLENPWSIAFLPDGGILVTERAGRLRIVRDGELLPEPIDGVPPVYAVGQGGLMDVVLHPDFDATRLVYLSYSRPNADESAATTAVIRGRLEGERLVDVEDVFEARAWSSSGRHFGSRLVFDGDGHLFITIGDRGVRADRNDLEGHPAQDLRTHQGTIVRLRDDGRVPADNPFVGLAGALPDIWSYGHRNAQGLVFHPETNELWQTEHGPRGGDELNLILPGRNYGWPVIGHGVEYIGTRIHESTAREGMEQPVHYWVPSIATSGLMLYRGSRFPEWSGDLFVGGLTGERIDRVRVRDGRVVETETIFDGFGRIRDVREGPDGYIYVVMDQRRGSAAPVVRLEPAGAG
jgi:aldose sugar dehydrogenase